MRDEGRVELNLEDCVQVASWVTAVECPGKYRRTRVTPCVHAENGRPRETGGV